MNISSSNLSEAFVNYFQQLEKKLNGEKASPLHQIKKQAINIVAENIVPTIKDEEWKYTNLNKIFKQDFVLDTENKEISTDIFKNIPLMDLDVYCLVVLNGVFKPNLSNLPAGIEISTIAEASKKNPNIIEKYFSKVSTLENELFVALNTAFASQGLFIYAEKNKTIDKPILIQHISDSQQNNVISLPRHLFVFEQGSQISVIENYATLGDNYSFVNGVTEIFVMPNAHISHTKIQNETEKAFQILTTQVKQEKDSVYDNVTISFKGGLIRNNLNIRLTGQNIESNMFGLYMLDGKTHVDNHTIADHIAPNSVSNELYKGILGEQSTGVFNGKIFVRQDAQKTNAYQQNRNILLTDTAHINTKPQLEIWADDVKCSHGATIGKLDLNALFYLRARGISEKHAKALLVQAFGAEIIEKVTFEPLKEYLRGLLMQKLHIDF
ncbi:MAG: Fe-S cluster assembly protein SufD [Bacteroidetes bacterium]|nr:MAG: Fe-S cluster assembly protein SufD [Bacteroidota bacterium]